jgi:hypothetical protein
MTVKKSVEVAATMMNVHGCVARLDSSLIEDSTWTDGYDGEGVLRPPRRFLHHNRLEAEVPLESGCQSRHRIPIRHRRHELKEYDEREDNADEGAENYQLPG